jgi:adenosylcobyric acid synthase
MAAARRHGEMPGRALMFQGTGSDVGKSLIVAALARAFSDRGLAVRPFKPQNMSNNAAVTADGGEIGRAQALQARAARTPPSVHMNPVLLKPQSETGAQIVVQGRVHGTAKAAAYQHMKAGLMTHVLDSFGRLREEADLVLVEGAGSASETNLRANDIANMGFARAAGVPVVLIGDIERGGVIASLVGTKVVIDPADAALVVGFLVNKFRGDPALFASGLDTIARATGWAPLGLIPYFPDARLLPAEDALALDRAAAAKPGRRIKIAVPVLPHIANFDDLDPLEAEPAVEIVRVRPGMELPGDADLIILPGSKATVADLVALRGAGFHIDIAAHLRRGRTVIGLCGGYQMLGRSVSDPAGIEGPSGAAEGLGFLDVETVLSGEKRLEPVQGEAAGEPFAGYEMHMGVTAGPDCVRPFARLADGTPDGAMSADGRVIGTYIHGLFGDDRQRSAWLARLGAGPSAIAYEALVETTLDRLAAHVAAHVDLDRLLSLAR